jgi:putative ABC transport system permease protein
LDYFTRSTSGDLLTRINGLVVVLGILAGLACTLSVMGVLTSSVLDRQTEVALMKALGAHGGSVLGLFLTEAAVLGLLGGLLAAATGSRLGAWLLRVVFGGQAAPHGALWLLAPLLGGLVALAATALPVLRTLRRDAAAVLHGN